MITSTSNQQIKNFIKCRKDGKERKKQDIFLVEGIRMFREIPSEQLMKTFVTEAFFAEHEELFTDVPYELTAEHVMEAVSDTKTPQGVVSMVKRRHYSVDEVCGGETPLVLALEHLQDPGNLGTILRTAEASGVTGVLMSQDTVDIYNPKAVRATMGSIFRIPFCYVENLTGCIDSLKDGEFTTYAAHLQGTTFYDFDYCNPTIFCIGNEGNGLSKELSEVTQRKIKIPMMGKAESLNVAIASAVLMYEAMRQRNARYRQK